jgi:hypothetical protein
MLTDRMAELATVRRELLDVFLPVYEMPARPIGLLEGEVCPSVFRQEVVTENERYDVVAVFNWEDEPREMTVDLPVAGPRVAFEFWTQEFLGVVEGRLGLGEIPPHGVRVIALRQALDRPFVMGTDVHLTQGGVELSQRTWDAASAVLTVRMSWWARCPRTAHVYVPDGFSHPDAQGHHLAVRVEAGPEAGFAVHFGG